MSCQPVVGQWNAFVELLPLWLAPNMVTLLGFFFILTNVICLEIWMPDLVGPVGQSSFLSGLSSSLPLFLSRRSLRLGR